ncbi:RidA family protein [Brevibacillus parabrevis]|uniref:RidA family protein n=1 Tax=Brevibacillus parabrevis TaxID=54914 RepID=UPI0028D5E3E7|nr:RidA family protein [Brevibacillus parabrevis]
MTIIRKNPETVAPPVGSYTHLTILPRDAELLVLSGQVGMDPSGNLPDEVEQQLRLALQNVALILQSEGVSLDGIVKINISG